MEVNQRHNEGGGGQTKDRIPDPNASPSPSPSNPQRRGFKGKSCKGFLYYSSVLESKSKNPTCVGFPRKIQQVPPPVVGLSKERRDLVVFKYACAGYSVYLDSKDSKADQHSNADQQDKITKLPFCLGFEMLLGKVPATAASAGHDPAPAQKNKEREQVIPQRTYKPPSTTKEEYFNRFKRNADLVASGIVRDLYRVGNYVKDTLDDILYPYRRRPK